MVDLKNQIQSTHEKKDHFNINELKILPETLHVNEASRRTTFIFFH